jgi:secondary thiamine-phosphate synthase enzyme
MTVFQKTITARTEKIYDFVEITAEIEKAAKESKIRSGVVFANALHNTAALILQENDPTIHHDIINTLEKMVPMKDDYEHDYESNQNATAHIKSNLLGTHIAIPLKDGQLQLGTWQDVFVVELFEPRSRKVELTIVGD